MDGGGESVRDPVRAPKPAASKTRTPGRTTMALATLLVVGAITAAATTARSTAVPMPLFVGFLTAAVLAAAIARRGGPIDRVDGLVAIFVGVASSGMHTLPGVVLGHDVRHHVWAAWAYLQAWQAGDLLPVWLHHVGLGLPLPLFYGPLPYYVMAPAALFGAGVDRMLGSSFVVAAAFGAFASFRAVAAWTADRRAALVAAAAFSYAPYRLLDANYRAALGEAWALAVLPLVLFSFDRLLDRGGRRAAFGAASSVALLALVHPLSLLSIALLLPFAWLARCPPWRAPARSVRAALRAAGAGLAGLALAGFFLVPLAVELRETSLAASVQRPNEVPRFGQHGLHPHELIDRTLWERSEWSLSDSEAGPNAREMPYYAGVFLVGALILALPIAFIVRDGSGPLAALGLLGLAALALSLVPVARSAASLLPVIDTLQFPWRFLGPASVAAALSLGLLVAAVRGAPASATLAVLAGVAVLADGFPHSGAVGRALPWHGLARVALSSVGLASPTPIPEPWPLRVGGELLPPRRGEADVGNVIAFPEYLSPAKRAALDAVTDSVQLIAFADGRLEHPRALPYARVRNGRSVHALRFERRAGTIVVWPRRHDRRIEVAEQAFRGWQVEVAGAWRDVRPSKSGLLAVALETPGEPVRFRFRRWPLERRAGWLLTFSTAVAFVAWARRPEPNLSAEAPA